jgi:hypothetical protein
MKDAEPDVAGYLNELAEKTGASVATVADGHVIMFTSAMLENLLERSKESGKVIVFIKRPDATN